MRSRPLLPVIATFAAAAAAAVAAANVAVDRIEARTLSDVSAALAEAGFDWSEAEADGLRLELGGTAPDEAARFRALGIAGRVIDGARVIDGMEVAARETITAPHFSIEVLRGDDGITMIGLVPEATDRFALLEAVARAAFESPITDLLQSANFPAPEGWEAALDFGLEALERSERAKISISADRVAVTTMTADEKRRDRLVNTLAGLAPEGLDVAFDITAPRPVITPFVLRLSRTAGDTRVAACSAGTEAGRDRILAVAADLGADDVRCPIGLGAPSPEWPAVAARALEAMRGVATGTLTLSDLDIRLEAGPEVPEFGRIVAALRADLPEEFTLTALQADAEAVEPEVGAAEFTATRSPEGAVELRGRVGTALARSTVSSMGRALFGTEEVAATIDIVEAVPRNWTPRLLAMLDALSRLHHGAGTVSPDGIRLSGVSGNADAAGDIARLLARRLGDEADYEIDIRYDKRLDAELALPTPEQCVAQINDILAARQITFDPGSATIDPDSRDSVAAVAEIVGKCEGVTMEVGGFTDSQGREEMNRELSQSRAEAVLSALLARRVPVGDLTAIGYGEESPIADNDTAEGREANRRIEFRLIEPENADMAAEETAAADAAETAEAEQNQ